MERVNSGPIDALQQHDSGSSAQTAAETEAAASSVTASRVGKLFTFT